MRDENVLSWNLPNVISVWLMIVLLGAAMGIASHTFYRKRQGRALGVAKDNSGELVASAA